MLRFLMIWSVITAFQLYGGEVDLEQFRNLLSSGDVEGARHLADVNEQGVDEGKSELNSYFNAVEMMVRAIVQEDRSYLSDTRFSLLLYVLNPVFERSHRLDLDSAAQETWIKFKKFQSERLSVLFNPKCIGPIDQSDFIIRRSRITRVVALFFSEVNRNLDIVPKGATPMLNVLPPLNSGHELIEAGMDPQGIKDPESRAAYEKAIAANSLLLKKVNLESYCQSLSTMHWRQCREFLIGSHSTSPDFNELAEFLMLLNANYSEINDILKAVAVASKKDIPFGLRKIERR